MFTVRIFTCLLFCAVSRPAWAEPFSQIWVFGGPLVDMGNYASVFGDLPPPFDGNRFCNGPLAVEYLAQSLGLEVSPSLHRVGPVKGNNFASVDGSADGKEPQDLHGQIDAYLASTRQRADPHALYYVSIGGNEVIAATLETDTAQAVRVIQDSILGKEHEIERLVKAGAKTLFVPNFINIGITPQIRQKGLAERGRLMSQLYNKLSNRSLDRLDRRFDIELIRDDFGGFADDVLRNADRFRFTNTTDSCLDTLAKGGECDFAHFIFFTDLFPTARVQEMWGWNQILDLSRQGRSRR